MMRFLTVGVKLMGRHKMCVLFNHTYTHKPTPKQNIYIASV